MADASRAVNERLVTSVNKRLVRRVVDDRAVNRLSEHLDPVVARVYAGRGVSSARETDSRLKHMLPPAQLLGIEDAAALLADAIEADAQIVIVGDYDADGATSTAVAVLGLRAMGACNVSFLVPDRFEYGYGLSEKIVAKAAESSPDLIITVDNGIASVDGVAAANQYGISVLITDHHLPGEVLPEADAIVNPNLPGCGFSSKHLAGVGVMFYLLAALRQQLMSREWFAERDIAMPNLATLIDLVALGTVADLVRLDANNRILVAEGLRRIRAGKCRPGILALLARAGRDYRQTTSRDLGFYVAPRLNAAGRLQDMSLGIACLLSDNTEDAETLAEELDSINKERRRIEARMQTQAMAEVSGYLDELDALPSALCLHNEEWHHGVVGLIASRLKERTDRPVVAFAPGENGELRGSARSIPGFHIRDALERVATLNPKLISKFGGHAMAAGLSLAPENLSAFRDAFVALAGEHQDALGKAGQLLTDGPLDREHLTLDFCLRLREAGPWGQGFEEPLFEGVFVVVKTQIVAEKHVRMELSVPETEQRLSAIAFNMAERCEPPATQDLLRVAYRLEANDYQGRQSLQLVIVHFESGVAG